EVSQGIGDAEFAVNFRFADRVAARAMEMGGQGGQAIELDEFAHGQLDGRHGGGRVGLDDVEVGHGGYGGRDAFVGPDRFQFCLGNGEVFGLEFDDVLLVIGDRGLGLHGDEADAGFMAIVDGAVQGGIAVVAEVEAEHDSVDTAYLGRLFH